MTAINKKVNALVLITKVRKMGEKVSKHGWHTYMVDIDLKHYTSSEQLGRTIKFVVPPDKEYKPIVGDTVRIVQGSFGSWIVDVDSPQTGRMEPHDYKRDVSVKTDFELDDVNVEMYLFPDYGEVSHFEIRPVACFLNPLTGETFAEAIVGESIQLNNHPNEIIWSIYQRLETGEAQCIADFRTSNEANKVYMYLRDVLKVTQELTNLD